MILTKDKFGRLELFASLERERKEIKSLRETSTSEMAAEDSFINNYLQNVFVDGKEVSFENLEGQIACWGGPAMSDGKSVYYYSNYALDNYLEKLQNGEVVRFDIVKN